MISFIIPTLNEERVLGPTLASLKMLIGVPSERIVSDGQSTDQTCEIARRDADHVVVYAGTTRQTIANARNAGAQIATGGYLVFLDADVSIPSIDAFFETILRFFAQDAGLSAVTVPLRVVPTDETMSDRWFFGLVNLVHRVRNNVLRQGSTSGEFLCVRAEAFRAVGGFDESLVTYEDVDLFERLAKVGKTRFIPTLTVFHSGRRVHRVGHLSLLITWLSNALWVKLFHKAKSEIWEPIR